MRRVIQTIRAGTLAWLVTAMLAAAEHRGQVTFRGLPVPGATIVAAKDGKKATAITTPEGWYAFPELEPGSWTMQVEMTGFATLRKEVTIQANAPSAQWELTMLQLADFQTLARSSSVKPQPQTENAVNGRREPRNNEPPAEDLTERAADGFLIHGSANNSAASPFAQAVAFGNNRSGGRSLYNAGLGFTFGNSALDARPFSLTGQSTPKADYNRMTGMLNLGGPLRIPHLLSNGPTFFVGYQWMRNNNATTASAIMPTLTERGGSLNNPVLDPATGAPFPGNTVPESRISPQARALLDLYPVPNFMGGTGYNYQTSLLNPTHQDALQSRLMKSIGSKNQVFGSFNFQSTRSDTSNVFGFLDKSNVLGVNSNINWTHRMSQRWLLNLGYQFSRQSVRMTPHFENRENVSGLAGITGNNQDPMNWGPPSLNFSSGIATLNDAQSSFNRSQTSGMSYSLFWNRGAHNLTFGGDFRRQSFNYLSQEDPRGSFTFTGAASGQAFADFLLGIPTASSIAYGNSDKYFRQSVYSAYISDDWRLGRQVTLNAGLRWEYGAPITELYGRLVNLDVAHQFAAAEPVVASDPTGPLTGQQYPQSLVEPFKRGFSPRAGIAWRPVAGSSLVVRAGYGIYNDTSIYPAIALRMAQQPPLSNTSNIQNSAATPLTLADGFKSRPTANNTFGVDRDFRPGYAQNWQLSIQRDLPGSLQMNATYLGIKGTHAMQAFLPNTFPAGTAVLCSECPTGFAYIVSHGNSSRQAAQLQLRRRLRNGFGATLQYTFSKSIDDAAVLGRQGVSGNPQTPAGGLAIAQNWQDLGAERGLSSFDQRHLLSLQMQYTTGMSFAGGTLLSGWTGGLMREWTFATQITAGSGLPQTPIYLAPVQGTGVTGTIRPDYTGAPLYSAPDGLFLNPAAYTAPVPGQWGNAGRNSIARPGQFNINASLGRTFRLGERFNLDLRVDAVNALNRVNYTAWNTTVNGAQFGLPVAASVMRNVQTTLRLRF